jgi:tRNA dimethylallyltransferase
VEQAVDATAQATRRFARRQESWFRPDHRTAWLHAGEPDGSELLSAALEVIGQATTRAGAADSAKPAARHTGQWAP